MERILVVDDVAKNSSSKSYLPALDTSRAYFRFWGTRGSTPVAGERYARYGGNTPCFEVGWGNDRVIFDAGSGIRELGIHLMKDHLCPLYIFIGHTHWDHIQGFPFFLPAYVPGAELHIYGASGFGKDLESVFRGQLDADYFPIQLNDMKSKMEFIHLKENPVKIGKVSVFWEYVHHPGAAVGFKIAMNGKVIVYISDNEFLQGYLSSPKDVTSKLLAPYKQIMDFIADSDILITESQYPNDEYAQKIGWGHTALSNGCLLCKLTGVKRWIVTHHDPAHDDEFLERKLLLTKQILGDIEYPIQVCHAFDGFMEYV